MTPAPLMLSPSKDLRRSKGLSASKDLSPLPQTVASPAGEPAVPPVPLILSLSKDPGVSKNVVLSVPA